MFVGFESVADLLVVAPVVGEGSADNNDDDEKTEWVGGIADVKAASLLWEVELGFSHPLRLSDGRIQDAKAARCNGKHPCLVSLIPQASGKISINNRIKRQASTNGSSSIVPVSWNLTMLALAARSYHIQIETVTYIV